MGNGAGNHPDDFAAFGVSILLAEAIGGLPFEPAKSANLRNMPASIR